MTFNDLTLVLLALVSAAFVLTSWKLDKERLYGVIFIFLLLISIAGSKLIVVFGHETNTGNVFYAAIFLATYFLIERHGKREGLRSIGITLIAVIFFNVLVHLVTLLDGSGATAAFDQSLAAVFSMNLRVAGASLLAYVASQLLNIWIYLSLRARFGRASLWLRANAANAIAQLLDSAVFFSLAFMGIIPSAHLTELIVTGYIIKVLFMAAAAPLLYFNKIEEDSDATHSTVIFR